MIRSPAPSRSFADAIGEIADWLTDPVNADEFLVLFLDDQPDLAKWGKVTLLLDQISQQLPPGAVLTPPKARELVDRQRKAGRLLDGGGGDRRLDAPTTELIVGLGYRVLFLSGTDFGAEMDPMVFSK